MENEEYDFEQWTATELFYFLIDMHQIPYESEFDDFKRLKPDMIRWCRESFEHQILDRI